MTSCCIQSYGLERPIPDYIRSVSKVHLRNLCKTPGVSTMSTSTYWGRYAVDKSDIIVLAEERLGATRSGGPRIRVCGMALVRDTQISELYLDLICGSGWGRRLFNEVERIGRDFGKRRIRLSAINDSLVRAYGRLGLVEKDDACNKNEPTLRWGNAENGYRMTKCLDVPSA